MVESLLNIVAAITAYSSNSRIEPSEASNSMRRRLPVPRGNGTTEATARSLTVPEVARRYRVSEDKVRGWIRRGKLAAINTASTRCGRPRFVITTDALSAFERGHAAETETPQPMRRPPRPKGFIDYFPD